MNGLEDYNRIVGPDELHRFSSLVGEFWGQSSAYKELHWDFVPDVQKLGIITKAISDIPFDYTTNAIKTAEIMKKKTLISLEDTLKTDDGFHHLQSPTELLENYLDYGIGGDCFTTSLVTQLIFETVGLDSSLVLCYDKEASRNDSSQKHHCAVKVQIEGKDYYVDTSLNLGVPIPFYQGEVDSGDISRIFRMHLGQDKSGQVAVSHQAIPHDKDEHFAPRPLWYFENKESNLPEVLRSMLYTLHPEVPSAGRLNRNQQFRITDFNNGRRNRIFYHPGVGKYVMRTVSDQKQGEGQVVLNLGHDNEGQLFGSKMDFADYVGNTFMVDSQKVIESLDALDYINKETQ